MSRQHYRSHQQYPEELDESSDSYAQHHPDDWNQRYDDELDPSDSASVSADHQPHRKNSLRDPARRHSRASRQQAYYGAVQLQSPNMSSDPSDEYYPNGRGGYAPSAHPHYGYQHQAQAAYPQYGAGAGAGRQMVQYQQGSYAGNPFQTLAAPQGGPYYEQPRQSYEMVAGHHVPYQQNYYGGNNQYALAPPYMFPAPPPPPTEVAKPATPAPAEKKIDPELELMKQKLEMFEREKAIQREAEERKAVEEAARKAAEIRLQEQMEVQRKAKEEADKELAKAKVEAERAARDRIEAERKAKEEDARQQKLAIERIEAETRLKLEKEQLELVEKRQRQEEIAKAAEEALKAKVEAAEAAARAKAAAEFKAEVEAKEAAERKIKEEIEWRKKLEEEAKLKAEVEARAKLEEERKKAEAAKAAEDERKKAEKAMRDKIVEETKAKIQDDAKKNAKPPIRFKDAVGRKFSFPFHLCQTWPGMEELIKQAFVQIETIGPHVQEGHYDLIGPNGEIILPSIWEKVVQPDWAITMHMWPMDKSPPLKNVPQHMHPGMMHGGRGVPMPHMQGRSGPIPIRPGGAMHPGAQRPYMPGQQPGVRPGSAGPHMPMHEIPMGGVPGMGHIPVQVVDGDHRHHSSSHDKKKGSSSKAASSTMFGFFSGKPAKSSKKRK